MDNQQNMKPIYLFDNEQKCGVIEYNNNKYYMDIYDRDAIINFNKKFVFNNVSDLYPSYNYNQQKINYLMFLYKFKENNVKYIFNNNNHFDLRRSNVNYYHIYHDKIISNYTVKQYIPGHYSKNGVDPYYMKNPIWKIEENENEYLFMYCEKDTICKLCSKSYQRILDFESNENKGKKITFHKHSNGYILSSNKSLFIHQIITGCYGNGKGTKNISVDHIDQNPLNNTIANLRIATREEQEQNTKGIKEGTQRERSSKKDLPDGISYEMFKKYVYYNREFYDKEKTKEREFFRVEHPKLDKPWATTKSEKVSILEKLAQANKIVDDLENDIYPEKSEPTLTKYVSLVVTREKPHLVFEKRIVDGTRLNIKMVLPEDYNLQDQIAILNEKIKAKYEGQSIL